MRRFIAVLLLLVGLAVGVGQIPAAPGQEKKTPALDPDVKALVEGNNEFAFDLYKKLAEKEKGNIVFSPYSISTALAMAYAGARDNTAERMAKALHFTLPQERLHPACGQLIADLQKGDKTLPFALNVANALWAQTGYPFQKDFLALTEANYGTGIRFVDFRKAEQTRKIINGWVEEQTKNNIKELLSPTDINPNETLLVLANAIYFKANWKKPFPKEQTKEKSFDLANGEKVNVPMMYQNGGPFNYRAGGGFQVLELPYAGDRLSMLFILPTKKDGLQELEKTLSSSVIKNGMGTLYPTVGEVALPRFKMTVRFSLLDQLQEMGMPAGPFDNMAKDRFFLTFIVHQAFIDLDETGTTAAAATAGGYSAASGGGLPFSFQADHPFLFLIRDRQTGTILFRGRVTDPRN